MLSGHTDQYTPMNKGFARLVLWMPLEFFFGLNHTNLYLTCMAYSAGAFQSDALLVPEHCLFDHIHNQTKCWDFDQWNRTASNACQERGMKVKSFAMLLPCGIDVFSGVEFVCCPSNKAASSTKKGYFLTFSHGIEPDA